MTVKVKVAYQNNHPLPGNQTPSPRGSKSFMTACSYICGRQEFPKKTRNTEGCLFYYDLLVHGPTKGKAQVLEGFEGKLSVRQSDLLGSKSKKSGFGV